MADIERAQLIPVSGSNDQPDTHDAIDVQFNPASLKVALSNTLKANPRNGTSQAAQFVDKSSSTLSVELIFDTTVGSDAQGEPASKRIEEGSDVRKLTGQIAEHFMKPVAAGDQLQAPRRCLFQWGAFEFLGLVQSFDETLDFFSPEGRPLRATVSLKLSEDRYQFRSRDIEQAERATPRLTPTGGAAPDADNPAAGSDTPVHEASAAAGQDPRDWRETALYNGIESPRLPAASALAVPPAGAAVTGGAAFRVGVSASVGTGIGGAFASTQTAGSMRAEVKTVATSKPRLSGVGFD
ncbi:CIS tube protein [Thioalkalivibrio paradoxus]|uniref:Contractile injection system tube protein N-terminal domain-containing protein n=1 Tax=Thioalkalivibrio paradoxus ARh 1 TaxID=713585 RepID=W0DN55_9GAMM|nr:hypothetical protein [Thioalkalivibrio paradoxus]AHE99891.1 hypothetical protein THITH_03105 [Thioalkalivibrio paradoxus ARh 1]